MNSSDPQDSKFKHYLVGELYWKLEQHPHISSPFAGIQRESVEVLSYRGYESLRVRVGDAVYEIQLSWKKAKPPVTTKAAM